MKLRQRRRLPSLNTLRAFEAAAYHGSITRAAEELNVTHSAVSHQIKALEQYLGIELMQRKGRSIMLTGAGQLCYPELEAAFDRIAVITERIAHRQQRSSLSINVMSSFATRWLIPRMVSFCKAYPEIDVRFATNEKMLDFNPHAFDISIRSLDTEDLRMLKRRRDWEQLHILPFMDESSFPVCSPALLQTSPLQKPADLCNHTLLHSRSVPRDWRDWLAAAGGVQLNPEAGLTFDSIHFALQAASRGLGVAIGSRPLVQDDLDLGTLVIPFPGIESQHEKYYLIYPEVSGNRSEVNAFSEWIVGAGVQTLSAGNAGT